MSTDKLKYPIGPFIVPKKISTAMLRSSMDTIEDFPYEIEKVIEGLTDKQLDTVYRPGGWTIRQVIHHLADSHMNAYIRFKLALTENTPIVKPYLQDYWAMLPDGKKLPVEISIQLLKGVHTRWMYMLHLMPLNEFDRSFYHPEKHRTVSIKEALLSYAWHGAHHLAHIIELKKRKGW